MGASASLPRRSVRPACADRRSLRPLAYVSDGYPTLSQTFTLREVRGLHADGIPVEVFSLHAPGAEDPPLDPALDPKVTLLPKPWAPDVLVATLRAALRHPARFAVLLARVLLPHTTPWRLLLQSRAPLHLLWGAWLAGRLPPDTHLHAQFVGAASNVAWIAARLRGTTFSFTSHNDWGLPLLREKLRDAQFALAISEHQRRLLLGHRPGVAEDRVIVSRLGIDLARWGKDSPPAGEAPLRIVSTGRLGLLKGHDVLIEAVASLRDAGIGAHLDIVGGGPERPRLDALVASLDARELVTLHGARPHEDVLRLTLGAHVVALACRVTPGGDVDGIPIALMEGMAAGKAVVSCRVGAVGELIEDGVSGLLVPQDRPDLLAAALERLARDPSLRERLGAAAQRRVAALHDGAASRRRMRQVMRGCLASGRASFALEAPEPAGVP